MTYSFSQKEVLLTSESVTEGHPDKLCDQISDAVLDAILKEDPFARVACECAATTGLVLVGGEITTECYVDIPQIARQVICEVGYNSSEVGFDGATCGVLNVVKEQSKDIKEGVDQSLEVRQKEEKQVDSDLQIGAGDQGLMIGFACRESEEYMPLTIVLAHKLCQRLAQVRKKGKLPYLGPDGKSQVTIRYYKGQPQEVTAVVLSSQHSEEVANEKIRKDLLEEVVKKVIPSRYLTENTIYHINPSGRFVLGGPIADSGLTGRKIMVDSYGGIVRHGGGCFSGKDATKVDRSANYAARWVAKNLVAAEVADRMEVHLAYAIGVAQPLAISVETFGTGKIADEKIVKIIREVFDLRPGAIIRDLKLRRPLYLPVAAYGHFGRLDLDLPWERLDRVEAIKKLT